MKTSLCAASALALGVIGLAACDGSQSARSDDPPIVAPDSPEASETPTSVLRGTLAEIVRDPDAYSRARRLGTLLPTLGPDAVPAVEQTLRNLQLDIRGTETELLTRFWATHQPEAATEWAKQEPRFEFNQTAVFAAVSVWAAQDPIAAVNATWEWAMLPRSRFDRVVPSAVVNGWYERDDPDALQVFIHGLPPGVSRQRAIAAYIQRLLRSRGGDAVIDWAESRPDDDRAYKLAVFRRVTSQLAMLDVDAARVWCERHCDGPHGANLRTIIGSKWVLQDGPAAMAWLEASPPGYERDVAVRNTFLDWSVRKHEAAMAWMASRRPEGPDSWLEPAYLVYAKRLSGERPTEAIEWAQHVENEHERERLLIGIARVWRHSDEAAAEAWLSQSPLSEAAREKARQPGK